MAKLRIPKTIGACADLLFDLRAARLEAQKIVDAIAEDEKAVKEHIINTLPKGDTGAAGKHHQVSVFTDSVPRAADWGHVFAYIKKNNAFDLLQRRLNDAAVKERWEDKKVIPGIEPFNIVKVSLTKKKGK